MSIYIDMCYYWSMQFYQPEFIEDSQIRDILKACIPYIDEKAGRYWLDACFKEYDYKGVDGLTHTPKEEFGKLKMLIAEGLNSLNEEGNLKTPISNRKWIIENLEGRREDYYSKKISDFEYRQHLCKIETIVQEVFKLKTKFFFEGYDGFYEAYELALFEAWQQAINKPSLSGKEAESPEQRGIDPPKDIQKAMEYLSDYLGLMDTPIDGYRRYYAKGAVKDLPLQKDSLYNLKFYQQWIYNPKTQKPVSKAQLEKAYYGY